VPLLNRITVIVLACAFSSTATIASEIEVKNAQQQTAPECSAMFEVIQTAVGVGMFAFFYGRWVGFRAGHLERRYGSMFAKFHAESAEYLQVMGHKIPIPCAASRTAKENIEALLEQAFLAGQKHMAAQLKKLD
jgi:hypothetical protein